jgi:hypothetical protein
MSPPHPPQILSGAGSRRPAMACIEPTAWLNGTAHKVAELTLGATRLPETVNTGGWVAKGRITGNPEL